MAYPTVAGSTARTLSAVLGALAVVALLAALVLRFAFLVPFAVAFAAAAYALFAALRSESSLDVWAPFVAAALVLAGELAWWSIELGGAPEDRRLTARRVIELAMLAVVSATVGVLLLAAGAGGLGGGLAVAGVGVAAAAGAVAVITVLARRLAR